MKETRNALALIAGGIVIGVFVAGLLLFSGLAPRKISIGGIEWESATQTPQPTASSPTQVAIATTTSSPFVQPSLQPPAPQPTPTSPTVQQVSQQVDYQLTGGSVRVNYTVTLKEKEVLVGLADKFQGLSGCVAFIIVGPGNFDFWVESGIWYKWINTTPKLNDTLLQEQVDIQVNKYQCNRSAVQIKRIP
jgi:hypothetical protein